MVRPSGIFAAIIVAALVVTVRLVTSVASRARGADAHPVRRVFVFSLPQVSWEDLDRFSDAVPNLNQFLERAAGAGLTPSADHRSTKLADGSRTLGSGTRAVGDPATDLSLAIDLKLRTSAASAAQAPGVPSLMTSTARS